MTELTLFTNKLFDDIFNSKGNILNIEIENQDNKVIVKTEVPGINKENINIEYEGSKLIITAKKEQKVTENQFTEFEYGEFKRVLDLGENIDFDKINAELKNGILTIEIPKKEKKIKKIEIKES